MGRIREYAAYPSVPSRFLPYDFFRAVWLITSARPNAVLLIFSPPSNVILSGEDEVSVPMTLMVGSSRFSIHFPE